MTTGMVMGNVRLAPRLCKISCGQAWLIRVMVISTSAVFISTTVDKKQNNNKFDVMKYLSGHVQEQLCLEIKGH